MKQLAQLRNGPSFEYEWDSIDNEDQKIIAKSCVSNYQKRWETNRRKANNLIKDDMHAKALCVYDLKTHVEHGLFLKICEKALSISKDNAAALATIGEQIKGGWLQADILEMIKRMEPRAASKLVRSEDSVKDRHVAIFREMGRVPSRRSLGSSRHSVEDTEPPAPITVINDSEESSHANPTTCGLDALRIMEKHRIRTIDACTALELLLRRQSKVSTQAAETLRSLKTQVDYLLSIA